MQIMKENCLMLKMTLMDRIAWVAQTVSREKKAYNNFVNGQLLILPLTVALKCL